MVASPVRFLSRRVGTYNIFSRAVQNAEGVRQRTNNAGNYCAEKPARRMHLRATGPTGE